MRSNLAALSLVAQLKARDWKCDFLTARLPRDLVVAAGGRLKDSPEAIAELRSAALSDETEAMAASLLHAADPGGFRQQERRPTNSKGRTSTACTGRKSNCRRPV